MAQLIGEALASALDQLAMDVRKQAVEAEQARMKGPGRDWVAIYGQLRRATIRQGGDLPNRRGECAGELYLVNG